VTNPWLDIARFVTLVVGFAYVVTQSSIFMPVRVTIARLSGWLRMFVYCAMCVSFWSGGVLATVLKLQPFHPDTTMLDFWDYAARFGQYGLMGVAVAHVWLYLTNSSGAAQIEHDLVVGIEKEHHDSSKAPQGGPRGNGRGDSDE